MSVFTFKSIGESKPYFTGTREEFNKYLSGFCRNLVQKITKPYKLSIGKCERCGSIDKQLDAAHVHGKERKEIISIILDDYEVKGKLKVNLEEFEVKFISHHQPIGKVIMILCKECHREYDALSLINEETNLQTTPSMKNPSYKSSSLLFKKSVIDPLDIDEEFIIHVTSCNETFKMTKAEFYQTFHNVAHSDSYTKKGIYSYTNIPNKAYKYLVTNRNLRVSSDTSSNIANTPKQKKVGFLVKEFFRVNGSNLSPRVIQDLQSKEYSKRELGCNFPVLIPKTNSKIIKGYNRYYKDEFVPGYWLCSQWYELDKEKFLGWKANL